MQPSAAAPEPAKARPGRVAAGRGAPRGGDPGLRALVVTAAIVWAPWLVATVVLDRWSLFGENYFMSITMVFGSFIAGATSEGGGAVAFPVMTLVFGIAPPVARDFSLMIQSVGMIAAGITILWTRVPVVRGCLVWTSIGGAVGVAVGLRWVAPLIPPPFAKMLFTSTWLAFAVALWMINRARTRPVSEDLRRIDAGQRVLLVMVGMLGGTVTAVTGSGLDIVTFSLLVLVFRICERVATPTSVVLMGVNALVGAVCKASQAEGLSAQAWSYWWVCVPVVVVGAPLGAQFVRSKSRLFIARFLMTSIVAQFVAALLIVPQTPALLAFSAGVFLSGLGVFSAMSWLGRSRARIRTVE